MKFDMLYVWRRNAVDAYARHPRCSWYNGRRRCATALYTSATLTRARWTPTYARAFCSWICPEPELLAREPAEIYLVLRLN